MFLFKSENKQFNPICFNVFKCCFNIKAHRQIQEKLWKTTA